jgi:hypothetical protein
VTVEKWRQTKRVDHAFILLGDAIQATDPFTAIAQYTDALEAMGTLEGRDEKVPWKYDDVSRVSLQDVTRVLHT